MFKDELIEGLKNKQPLEKYFHIELCYSINTKIIPIIVNKYIIDYFNTNFFDKSFISIKRGIKLYFDKTLLNTLEEIHKLGYIPMKLSCVPGNLYINSHIPIFKIEYEEKYKDILSIFFYIISLKISDIIHIYYYLDFLRTHYSNSRLIFIVNKYNTPYLEEILMCYHYDMAFINEYENIFNMYNLPHIKYDNSIQTLPSKIPNVSESNFLKDLYSYSDAILYFNILAKHVENIMRRKENDKLIMIDRHNGFKFNKINHFFSKEDMNMYIHGDSIDVVNISTGSNVFIVCYNNGQSKWK